VEELMRKYNQPENKQKVKPIGLPHHFQAVKSNLKNTFNTDVDIKRNLKGKGTIVIAFKSDNEFDRIAEMLKING
jgi:ParB family chromosome partitioning protein